MRKILSYGKLTKNIMQAESNPDTPHADWTEECSDMELEQLPYRLTVCKPVKLEKECLDSEFFFLGKTDEELSLICKTEEAPAETFAREDGWRGFRICGVLGFSLIGILSRLSAILAENGIGLFAVSTYNTDYLLVKEEKFAPAAELFRQNGYTVR